MSSYYAKHLRRLASEAHNRFQTLMHILETNGADALTAIPVDGVQVRQAVDDFKTILAEIRRLK